jgi:hypothetical protein
VSPDPTNTNTHHCTATQTNFVFEGVDHLVMVLMGEVSRSNDYFPEVGGVQEVKLRGDFSAQQEWRAVS